MVSLSCRFHFVLSRRKVVFFTFESNLFSDFISFVSHTLMLPLVAFLSYLFPSLFITLRSLISWIQFNFSDFVSSFLDLGYSASSFCSSFLPSYSIFSFGHHLSVCFISISFSLQPCTIFLAFIFFYFKYFMLSRVLVFLFIHISGWAVNLVFYLLFFVFIKQLSLNYHTCLFLITTTLSFSPLSFFFFLLSRH